jgi:signal transduction histidine kinase
MSITDQQHRPLAGGSENPLATDWLITHLRWLWLLTLLPAALLAVRLARPDSPDPTTQIYIDRDFIYVAIVIGVGAVINLIQVGALYTGWFPGWMTVLGIGFDTLISISLLALTGGWQSPMLPVVLFPLLVASLRLSLDAGLATAVSIAFAYAVFAIIALSSNGTTSPTEPSEWLRLYQVGLNVVALLGVASVSGLIHRQQKATQEYMEAKELRSLRRANERAKAFYEMASTLSTTLNYKRVLATMLDLGIMGLTDVTGPDTSLTGLVLLFEEEGNPERLKTHAGWNVPRTDDDRVVSGQSGLIARAIYTAEPVISEQVSSDPVLTQFVCMQNALSAICVPLRAGLETYGVVVFASSNQSYFTAEHGELLTTFSNQAIIALKNARLYEDLEAEQQKILEKESEARHKLARELHDGPTQTISAVAMRLNFIRMMLQKKQDPDRIESEVAKVEKLARKTTVEIRTMLFTLRPVVLETQGLPAALEQYAERLRQSDELHVEVDSDGYDSQLDKQAESVVFNVVEEAVSNARKHAHASQILVRLRVDDHFFTAEIRDDGIGFDVEKAQRRREVGHMGLLNIEERAELVGGRCSIKSQPGAGTLVCLDIPLRRLERT